MKSFDPAALACLTALVDEGSFERAAAQLAITQSAVSQRLRALEAQVGQRLVVRARPLRLTEPGRVLLRLARQVNALQADAMAELGRAPVDERLPIAVNADSLATWVLPALDPLVQQGVALELVVDDQAFTHDWLREGRVLGCVSTVREALRGCRVTPLCTMEYVAVVSPGFAARQLGPAGLHRGNFAQVPFLVFNRKDMSQVQWAERAFGVRAPRLLTRYVPSSEAYLRAAEMGWGVGVAARVQVQPALDEGRLVLLHPDVHVPLDLHWHQWRLDADAAGRGALLDRVGDALRAGAPRTGPTPRSRRRRAAPGAAA